jgi:hypothetical protein
MKLFIKEDIEDTDSFIYVDVVYYNNDDLDSMQHTDFRASGYRYLSEIMNMCVNAKDIDFDGINNIVVVRYKDKYYIASSGGFSDDRGLFTDLYDINKYISMNEKIEHKPTTEKITIKESDSDPMPVYNTGSIQDNIVYVDTTRLSWAKKDFAGQVVLQGIYKGQPAVLVDTSYNRHTNTYDVYSNTICVRGENKYLGIFRGEKFVDIADAQGKVLVVK